MQSTEARDPVGPEADVSQPMTGGGRAFVGSPIPVRLEPLGYVPQEHQASGQAWSFEAEGDMGGDGRWRFVPAAQAPYRTRVLVRRPADPSRCSGTAVVEWLNVSGGVDADPEWASLHEEILRRGHVWVGVSAQRIGVMGGPVLVEGPDGAGADLAGRGLRRIDPARYGSLDHPGDGFSFDIFTQVARAVRSGALVRDVRPHLVIAAGESQSAFALVTYYNGVQPLTGVFDGFFVHSRGAFGLPLVAPGGHADMAGAIMGGTPVIFRTDGNVPVLDVQSEADVTGVLNSYAARQPDAERFRLWEVAGTAHADAHLLGAAADTLDCGAPINDGPMHLVAKAGFRALTTWVDTGDAPTGVPRLDVTAGAVPSLRRNADGIAVGGIRTPPVDVPVATLSGEPGPSPSMLCLLLGTTRPLPPERLAALYGSREEYVRRYAEAADQAIDAGVVLPEDRDALLSFAHPSAVRG